MRPEWFFLDEIPFKSMWPDDIYWWPRFLEGEKFVLLDPRGTNSYDVFYDLGKLFHSVHGKYDLIREGLFSVEEKGSGISFSFDKELGEKYSKIYESLLTVLEKRCLEDNWMMKALFSEACHFSSVIPFQLVGDEKEEVALACYLNGVVFLNEVYEMWSKNYLRGYAININTDEDFKRAEESS